MAGKKKAPSKDVESAPEPILIIDTEMPEAAPASAPAAGAHSCKKCNASVSYHEIIDAQTKKGYCSVNCYISR